MCLKRAAALVLSMMLAETVLANQLPPEPFEESVLEEKVTLSSPGRLVLFSPVREVNNEIRSASMARLPIKGSGHLYRILEGASREEARDHYLRRLKARGAQIIFECSGRGCGRSNVWANQVFEQSNLYGRDENQDYLIAGSIDENGKPSLTLIYTVTRANKREYVWVEQLESPPGTSIPGLGTASARIKGPVLVPWKGSITYNFEWTATDRRLVNEWAGLEGAEVVLVGYSELGENETLEDAMKRAGRAVDSLSRVLVKSGVSESQQKRIIAGPSIVIPNPDRQGNRVEIMVITR
ncbi:DUF4892 domain-containing protein [Marinobacter sp. CHS3-4]|uniref:DUF4892 domain-containing protein n=1 Tax=Marinobacter sp. CHS3-4 TaxID=3045174 RepID=UPI0024B59F6E|nr:DUF4892 domain-containing protein [Marinobacter sp. CHS3-4]MDI9245512.1 DUF4892 domain-containing protein [Marinobacter sp. CHS3-4]